MTRLVKNQKMPFRIFIMELFKRKFGSLRVYFKKNSGPSPFTMLESKIHFNLIYLRIKPHILLHLALEKRFEISSKSEKFSSIVYCDLNAFFQRDAPYIGKFLCHVTYPFRGIGLTAKRNGSQVRAVGLYKNTVQRELACGFYRVTGVFKG